MGKINGATKFHEYFMQLCCVVYHTHTFGCCMRQSCIVCHDLQSTCGVHYILKNFCAATMCTASVLVYSFNVLVCLLRIPRPLPASEEQSYRVLYNVKTVLFDPPLLHRCAFLHFCSAKRPKLKQENPSLSVGSLAKQLSSAWKLMTPEQKKPYDLLAEKDKQRCSCGVVSHVSV